MRIYLAAPLFSDAELSFNARLEKSLCRFGSVFLPQRDGLRTPSNHPTVDRKLLFQKECETILASNLVVAVLGGRAIDERVTFELGFAFASGICCVGYQAEARRLLNGENKHVMEECLAGTFSDVEALSAWLAEFTSPILWFEHERRIPMDLNDRFG